MAIMAKLHQEHLNLKRLLDILNSKVEKFRAGTRPNYQLMSDVVSFVGSYADTHHHPQEDSIFSCFMGRDRRVDELMQRCEAQHAELHQLSTSLLDSIEGVLHDAAVLPMEQLVDQLELFVTRQAEHLDFEENEVFPSLEQIATEQEWQQLESRLAQKEDPLLTLKQSEEYRDLYKALMEDSTQI